uniref:EF-hand domain-containing protein n=1 Tax=Hucho hucho TaxID=62062 RepID=A0A4W5NV18_9TELE
MGSHLIWIKCSGKLTIGLGHERKPLVVKSLTYQYKCMSFTGLECKSNIWMIELLSSIKSYSYSSFFSQVFFEMFDEEENGTVKTQELERLLLHMAKDVDKAGDFLGLMVLAHERAKGQDAELRVAFDVFDNEVQYVLMNASEPLNELEAEQMMEPDKD